MAEVNYGAFQSNEYNKVSWVNSALLERPEGEGLEAYLASIAMKLHIISQDYTDQLETGRVTLCLHQPPPPFANKDLIININLNVFSLLMFD